MCNKLKCLKTSSQSFPSHFQASVQLGQYSNQITADTWLELCVGCSRVCAEQCAQWYISDVVYQEAAIWIYIWCIYLYSFMDKTMLIHKMFIHKII